MGLSWMVLCYMTFDPAPNLRTCLSPVAALAAIIEHQADSTVLDVGFSLAALIEAVLVGWIREESVGLASAEARSCAATATAAAAATVRLGHSGCDWRQGARTRSAGWGETLNHLKDRNSIISVYYQRLCVLCVQAPVPSPLLMLLIRGYFPWPQKVPLKSSRSKVHTMAPPKPLCFNH